MSWIIDKLHQRKQDRQPRCAVIVPAAGSASRMQGVDKILTSLCGIPVLARTLRALERCPLVTEIIVVTRADLIVPIADMAATWNLSKVTKVVLGGSERIHSVCLGVDEVSDDIDLIAIHDGARPFPSAKLLEEVILTAGKTGAAAPAIAVTDTIKRAENSIIQETVDRSVLWAVQTPQVFEAGLIKGALQKAKQDGAVLTDDCSAVERLGMQVTLTAGERTNIKLTTPFDLTLGEVIAGTLEDF